MSAAKPPPEEVLADGWCFNLDPPGEAKSAAEHERDLALIAHNVRRHRSRTTQLSVLSAALAYARRGWPVFPVRQDKHPLTQHGKNDATMDEARIAEWWRRWPTALAAIVTGEPSGVVALDIDIRPDGSGLDALKAMGIDSCPRTPCAHTPSGGLHYLFGWPGHFVKTVAGRLSPFLDVRGDGGSLILPPGPGRRWDPHLAYDQMPLAPMPAWMRIPEPEQPPREHRPPPRGSDYTRYGEAAMDRIVAAILRAPLGQQEVSINAEVYSIGRLVAGGEIGPDFAMQTLVWLSTEIPSLDARRPWRPADLLKKMKLALADGMQHRRSAADGR